MTPPPISVLLAVHNGEPHLEACLRSVLSQGHRDFEFLVVDDASTDRTGAILRDAARADTRLKLLRNDRNLGLTASLNRGLTEARGDYIARIDADDLCGPRRLEVQLAAMERDPGLLILGSGYRIIDGDGVAQGTVSVALSDARIRWLLGFTPPAFHPSYFFRRVAPDGAAVTYDESFRTAQDYDLWSRLSRQGRGLVLPDVLIDYRRHAGGISVAQAARQGEDARKISLRNLSERLPDALVARLVPLVDLLARREEARGARIRAAVSGMRDLLAFDRDFFDDASDRRWMHRAAAGLLADAILARGGAMRRPGDAMRFVAHAADFLPALALAVAERPATARKAIARVMSR